MTKVIFRKDKKTGEIIAFFPETYKEYKNGRMLCYVHIGQHGEANLEYYWDTKKAIEVEYKTLLNELILIGYDDLKIMQRMSYK